MLVEIPKENVWNFTFHLQNNRFSMRVTTNHNLSDVGMDQGAIQINILIWASPFVDGSPLQTAYDTGLDGWRHLKITIEMLTFYEWKHLKFDCLVNRTQMLNSKCRMPNICGIFVSRNHARCIFCRIIINNTSENSRQSLPFMLLKSMQWL